MTSTLKMAHCISRRESLRLAMASMATAAFAPSIASHAAQSDEVRMVSTRGNSTLTLEEVMREKGYLEKFNLKQTLVTVADGAKLLGSLLSGQSDICMFSGLSQVPIAIERGAPLKLVAAAILKPEHAFYSGKPEVKSIEDLAGKTIATGSIGALLHEMTIALLNKKGVDIKSVKFVNIGSTPDVFRAVAAKAVDAGIAEVDLYNEVDKYGVHVLRGGDLWRELPSFTFQASYASQKAIDTKRDVLVRTLAAYASLYRFLERPESKETYIAAQKKALGRSDEKVAAHQWSFFSENKIYATDLILSPERVHYIQELNVATGVQRRILPYEQVADMSLAQEALTLI